MRLVLDLDRQAPDISMPESAASYQGFYNKIRSEHEALINGYNDAKRRLAEHDFVRARWSSSTKRTAIFRMTPSSSSSGS